MEEKNEQKEIIVRPKNTMARKQEALVSTQFLDEMRKGCTKYYTPEQITRIAITLMKKNPKIALCDDASFYSCLMDCAAAGLPPDGRLCYLIPYGSEVKLIIGYMGILEIVKRPGHISSIHCDVVHGNDFFECSYGSDSKLVHKPTLIDRGDIVAAYSYVKMKDGGESFDVMPIDEIEKTRNASKCGKSGPWIEWRAEMCKKTVFRRHAKMLGGETSQILHDLLTRDFDSNSKIEKTSSNFKPLGRGLLNIEEEIGEKENE